MTRYHGILVIDKPAGWTSHDVVGWTRRWLGQKKVGHAGTLDPAATGVLPIVVGDATRFVEYLADATKRYLAEVTLGVETDSGDGDGVVIEGPRPVTVTRGEIERSLARLRGEITQRPPMHSAIKVGGKRLYDLARRGEVVEVPTRQVTVSRLDLLAYDDAVATLDVTCSKGTYVRALARDLGTALGMGAHLSNLVRTRTGPFTICEAWTVADLAEHDPAMIWPMVAARSDAALDGLPAVVLGEESRDDWHCGRPISAVAPIASGPVRFYASGGAFLGIGHADAEGIAYQPGKVLHDAA